MDWQANDVAVCLVGSWCDRDGFPLICFPPAGPDLGQMLSVAGIRRHPEFGSIDLRFMAWPEAWFDGACFQRIPPPLKRVRRSLAVPLLN
jgi:hypothetical protein